MDFLSLLETVKRAPIDFQQCGSGLHQVPKWDAALSQASTHVSVQLVKDLPNQSEHQSKTGGNCGLSQNFNEAQFNFHFEKNASSSSLSSSQHSSASSKGSKRSSESAEMLDLLRSISKGQSKIRNDQSLIRKGQSTLQQGLGNLDEKLHSHFTELCHVVDQVRNVDLPQQAATLRTEIKDVAVACEQRCDKIEKSLIPTLDDCLRYEIRQASRVNRKELAHVKQTLEERHVNLLDVRDSVGTLKLKMQNLEIGMAELRKDKTAEPVTSTGNPLLERFREELNTPSAVSLRTASLESLVHETPTRPRRDSSSDSNVSILKVKSRNKQTARSFSRSPRRRSGFSHSDRLSKRPVSSLRTPKDSGADSVSGSSDSELEDLLEVNERSGRSTSLKLTEFDGTLDVEVFISQVKKVVRCQRWREDELCAHLMAALKGPARDVLSSLPRKKDIKSADILRGLKARFGRVIQEDVARTTLMDYKQKRAQTFRHLGYEISKLHHQAYPDLHGSTKDVLVVQAFTHALLDQEVKTRVLLDQPKTLEKAISIAERVESALRQAKGSLYRRVGFVNEVDEEKTEAKTMKKATSQTKGASQNHPKENASPKKADQLQQTSRPPVRCFKCNEEGHVARNCPQMQSQNDGYRSPPPGGWNRNRGRGKGRPPQQSEGNRYFQQNNPGNSYPYRPPYVPEALQQGKIPWPYFGFTSPYSQQDHCYPQNTSHYQESGNGSARGVGGDFLRQGGGPQA
jgi:hypothetical protein